MTEYAVSHAVNVKSWNNAAPHVIMVILGHMLRNLFQKTIIKYIVPLLPGDDTIPNRLC